MPKVVFFLKLLEVRWVSPFLRFNASGVVYCCPWGYIQTKVEISCNSNNFRCGLLRLHTLARWVWLKLNWKTMSSLEAPIFQSITLMFFASASSNFEESILHWLDKKTMWLLNLQIGKKHIQFCSLFVLHLQCLHLFGKTLSTQHSIFPIGQPTCQPY